KVTTPEYVVDKATKLETIYNRIHEIRTRFEVIYRDLEINYLKNILKGSNKEEENKKLQEERKKLHSQFKLIAKVNIGKETTSDEDISQIEEIAKRTWIRYFDNTIGVSREEKTRLKKNKENTTPKTETLLSDKLEHIIPRVEFIDDMDKKYGFKQETPEHLYNLGELYNLKIKSGTLTKEERYKINEHIKMSIIMLEELPFQKNLKRVPEYAGAHHETLIGTGYPRKLKKEQMSIPARILAFADVFEALTSSDSANIK
ncbi:MAG: HD domain-containing protein, partial [Campylobacterales bacterium]|nr:HD domain-containing protein [Campylobacterales bacterium]